MLVNAVVLGDVSEMAVVVVVVVYRGCSDSHAGSVKCSQCECGWRVQQFNLKSKLSADTLSQFSLDSATSLDSKDVPLYVAAGDIRRRLSENVAVPKKKFDVCRLLLYVVCYLFVCYF